MQSTTEAQLELYLSFFRGRTDVYASRWEKNGRAGYSPAYDVDWTAYNEFKLRGGSFRDFEGKTAIALTPDVVKKHLIGSHAIGVYPILQDSTSCFIAADFDGSSWKQECKNFLAECSKVDLRAYLERSRSGNGGHVWIFFESAYPCYKSRQLMLELVRRALRLSEFDREVSFDRLFPNQNYLAKGGLGNLIALPLQGQSARSGNTVFLNPENFQPYQDQWKFLEIAHRHTIAELDAAHAAAIVKPAHLAPVAVSSNSVVTLVLNSKITLDRANLTPQIVQFLKDKLNFMNTEYLVKQRLGKPVYGVEKFFKLIEEDGDSILLPRGFLDQLTSFLDEHKTAYQIVDQRPELAEIKFTNNIQLLASQEPIAQKALQSDGGVMVAPSGSGKTIVGLEIIARRKLPSLILVHRAQLLEQWVERIQTFLGIPKKEIGRYSGTKKKAGKKITVAMVQTLARIGSLGEMQNQFGTIIVDECHHVPAKTFREVISELNPRFLYGLTATPERKHNDGALTYAFIGDTIGKMDATPGQDLEPLLLHPKSVNTEVVIRETSLAVPFKFTIDNFQLLAKIICFDTDRNRLIVKDTLEQVAAGKKVLLFSERRDHLEVLGLYLKGLCETITISGEDSVARRAIKIRQIKAGHYQAILSTGQFFGEGLDVPTIDCLIVAFPFSFEGKLIQYIGRLRGKGSRKVIVDYRDSKILFLERQFKQRNRYYRKLTDKR